MLMYVVIDNSLLIHLKIISLMHENLGWTLRGSKMLHNMYSFCACTGTDQISIHIQSACYLIVDVYTSLCAYLRVGFRGFKRKLFFNNLLI